MGVDPNMISGPGRGPKKRIVDATGTGLLGPDANPVEEHNIEFSVGEGLAPRKFKVTGAEAKTLDEAMEVVKARVLASGVTEAQFKRWKVTGRRTIRG